MGKPLGSRMGAMRCGEGIVHVEIAIGRNSLCEFGVVRLLARVETAVFQNGHFAIAHDADRLRDDFARNFRHEHDFPPQHFLDFADDHGKRLGRAFLSLGAAKMRQKQHLGTFFAERFDGRLESADTRIVGHVSVAHGHVQIDAHQRDLSGDVT